MILIDAGPLVAMLHADDVHHDECVAVLRSVREPLGTVWPAVTEAAYLLGFSWKAEDALFEMLSRGAPRLLPLDDTDIPRIRELMRKYHDLSMDLADAALVRAAEREGCRTVFTLDRRDFSTYRLNGRSRISILP